MDIALKVLPFAAFLACPLLMVACFFGMRRGGGRSHQPTGSNETRGERIAALEQQLQAIQSELKDLRAEPTTVGAAESEKVQMPVMGAKHAEHHPT